METIKNNGNATNRAATKKKLDKAAAKILKGNEPTKPVKIKKEDKETKLGIIGSEKVGYIQAMGNINNTNKCTKNEKAQLINIDGEQLSFTLDTTGSDLQAKRSDTLYNLFSGALVLLNYISLKLVENYKVVENIVKGQNNPDVLLGAINNFLTIKLSKKEYLELIHPCRMSKERNLKNLKKKIDILQRLRITVHNMEIIEFVDDKMGKKKEVRRKKQVEYKIIENCPYLTENIKGDIITIDINLKYASFMVIAKKHLKFNAIPKLFLKEEPNPKANALRTYFLCVPDMRMVDKKTGQMKWKTFKLSELILKAGYDITSKHKDERVYNPFKEVLNSLDPYIEYDIVKARGGKYTDKEIKDLTDRNMLYSEYVNNGYLKVRFKEGVIPKECEYIKEKAKPKKTKKTTKKETTKQPTA